MITDVSNNNIVNVNFLSNSLFTNSVFLDLSFNIITMINNMFFKNLVFLGLAGNPLKYIDLHTFQHNFKSLIDMQHIYYSRNMHFKFASALSSQLDVKVSESMICCIMSTDIKCTSSLKNIACFGHFNIKKELISSYCFTTLLLLPLLCWQNVFYLLGY